MKIEIRNLTKSYWLNEREVQVLKGVSCHIGDGEFVSITGPSGVGKSTLLHVLGTLDVPSGGTLAFDDVDIWSQPPAAIARFRNKNIGFVFQFHHLLPEFTALENTMMPGRVSRIPVAQAEKRAKEILADVGLADRMDHRPGELSGGQQQRVALARALMNEPRVLLADEPTGNLDEETGAEIHAMIEKLNKERGITAIIVTHNPRLADRMRRRLHLDASGLSDSQPQPASGGLSTSAAIPGTSA